ncbi:aldehyde dehydrogenase family protein [Saccharopolyspora phatthalungensis]|uniref:Acyl-CoA reductase-like NAD-dependent aldehyde dehydrogenase n=1 Tax=Saccharopolyspora phatthalungensis TaxID=664693 RepID=A0A840QL00_9PSEU|nr:aldehyde dehydrogenase family protein [Saccharopolyspora phatthalungensis]MBB5160013.1 acyl-CoA reductase-like NAD-dependent aldehyde dehydrogenase [Saccharopolyspora phatthalungensis]
MTSLLWTDTRQLDALGASGPFRASRSVPVVGVDGTTLAHLSLVPKLYIKRNLDALRRAHPMPAQERAQCLAAAGELFLGEVDGVSLREHELAVCRASGVAMPVVRRASLSIAESARVAEESVQQARPAGAVNDWRSGAAAGTVWVRKGEVFAVLAPGNHPATHTIWLEALAMGYRVAVRPSRREPFTPHRLVSALRQSGFGTDQVVLLPTDHDVADVFVREADLAMVYGGDEVAARYGARADTLVQGPGRSKVLLADGNHEQHIGTVVDSVIGHGATACVNASAVFVNGDAAGVAAEIARSLSKIPVRPPEADDAVLPAFGIDQARALEKHLRSRLGDAKLVSGPDLVAELPGGGAVLRPAVVLLDRADAPQVNIELPFPCVWVAPWSLDVGVDPLRNTLTLTAITPDEALLSRLIEEPSIRNLHIGDQPTYLMRPGLPHDGHLAEFLMRSKTVMRDLPVVPEQLRPKDMPCLIAKTNNG